MKILNYIKNLINKIFNKSKEENCCCCETKKIEERLSEVSKREEIKTEPKVIINEEKVEKIEIKDLKQDIKIPKKENVEENKPKKPKPKSKPKPRPKKD